MTDVGAGTVCENGDGEQDLARQNGGDIGDVVCENGREQEVDLLLRGDTTDSLAALSITSRDLKVDVKDLINIGNFEKARTVKPIKDQQPGYAFLMPYCQILCISTTILSAIFLILGYKIYNASESKAERFKYAGFAVGTVGIISFIAVIYINSVSNNSLLDSMRSFRKSKAANPQIAKKLKRNATDNDMRV